MKKNLKKPARVIAMLLAAALVMTGCGGSGSGSASRDTDTLRVSLNVEPTALHPGLTTSVVANIVGLQIYDTLLVKEDDEYLPSLATEWEWNEDNTELTFTLRDDVTFHNGDPLTAEDVAFTYNTIKDSSYADALCGFYDRMEVIDDTHVVLISEEPYGAAMETIVDPGLGILSKSAYEEDPEGFLRNPVGTGPYKFVSWDSGASINLEVNEDYWGQVGTIKNIEFAIYSNDATSAALALENGEVDLLTTVADTDLSRLQSNDSVQVATTSGSSICFIQFTMEDGSLFADENLRLAIAHAINKEEVLEGAAEGHGEVANSIFPSYSFGIADYEAPGYDPELAKEYLEKAGYPDGLDITVTACSTDTYYKPAEIIQAQLAEVGINLTLEKMEQNAWFEDVWRSGEYGMNTILFSASVADVLYYYQMFESNGVENFGHVSCPELDEAYARAYSTVDEEERAQACYDVVAAYGDHAVTVPIYVLDKSIAASADLQGLEADPIGYFHANELSWSE